ncbi:MULTISPECIES: DNA gyrase subunit A [Dictyoglomus]|uniref:DNA gyrase subunit A n=1 Tax=Dictyoglomus turgidum (strain DSM 6724 / Z-1310) TaxID=515635 RepID=B8E096_DICTD|nr:MULTISPECIES: DNA gyrase subunit A [Dictyoglomus]ACK42541.1 DNA gyrase, A subunit [Dictyoglomus turgidum DSM 6724]PNV79656.1 MAG: DNA gyrase subunit A [Dictyoglomus turgidum]HBU32255.1 DNA gyrase subunit A [Dictyoglomus sp.]
MAEKSKVILVGLEREMENSYLDYAMSVIVGRALPDARDGLKPVQRRIIYSMYESGILHNRPYRKSAHVVGNVLGRYHPHGDAAVYEALVRMAQDFSFRYPLIDGHGNFGSIDGDEPAAMRYTEVRLSPIASELIADIEKDVVDFVPNYDNSLREPVVLPTKIPQLLMNGSSGIAVGMATNIPPHNLGELIDALLYLIEKPTAEIEELLNFIKGPDFPTGGIIIGTKGIRESYLTGKGKLTVRGKLVIEETKKGDKNIIIKEIPYMVNKSNLLTQIAELVQEKKITGIKDLRDESDRHGIRVVIELKKDADPKIVINQLYKHTQLQTTFGVIMLAILDGQPKIFNLKELLTIFLEHRKDVVIRRTKYDLEKAKARAHILEGLLIALDHLDEVISIIRQAENSEKAKEKLMLRFKLTQNQAQAILDMRLHQLTRLEKERLMEEMKQIKENISILERILKDEKELWRVISEELKEIKKKYADERKTSIEEEEKSDITIEDILPDNPEVICITQDGYIKRLPLSTYQLQRRGGKGLNTLANNNDDVITSFVVTSTRSTLFLFSNKGKVYSIKTYELDETSRQSKGIAIKEYLNIENEERITEIISLSELPKNLYFFFITSKGIVKKTPVEEFENVRKSGIYAIKIGEGDFLVNVFLTSGNNEIIIFTRKGNAIRFHEKDTRPMGRVAQGVIGIKLRKDDSVIGGVILQESKQIVLVTKYGIGKRVNPQEFSTQKRGGIGIRAIKITSKTGDLIGVKNVSENDEILISTKKGQIIRIPVNNIPILSRNSQGVKLVKLNEDDSVVSMDLVENET